MYEPHLASAEFGGFWIRFLALLADSAIVFLMMALILAGGATALGEEGFPIAALAAWLFAFLYWPVLHASALQATVGKAMLGMRITGYQGSRISLLRSLGRELAKILSSAALMVGYILAAFTARKQALHDLVASTYVVREGRARVVAALATMVAGFVLPVAVLPMVVGDAMVSTVMAMVSEMEQAKPQPTMKAVPRPPVVAPVPVPKPQPAPAPVMAKPAPSPEAVKPAAQEVAKSAPAPEATKAALVPAPEATKAAPVPQVAKAAPEATKPMPEVAKPAVAPAVPALAAAATPAPVGKATATQPGKAEPKKAQQSKPVARKAPAKKAPPQPRPVALAKAPTAPKAPKAPAVFEPKAAGLKFNDLITAVLYRDAEAVSELLKFGRWPDKPDSRGTTPLMLAVQFGDAASAEALLKAGADGSRALSVAHGRRDGAMLDLLKRYASR